MIGKKGLSQVIGTLLMVLVTLGMIAALWGPLNDFISGEVGNTEACFGLFDKISLNNEYTCYNSTSNETYVSISMKDVNVTSLLVSIGYIDGSKLFTLNEGVNLIEGVTNFANVSAPVLLPKANSGKTYTVQTTGVPISIDLVPTIGMEQCDEIDSWNSVPNCF